MLPSPPLCALFSPLGDAFLIRDPITIERPEIQSARTRKFDLPISVDLFKVISNWLDCLLGSPSLSIALNRIPPRGNESQVENSDYQTCNELRLTRNSLVNLFEIDGELGRMSGLLWKVEANANCSDLVFSLTCKHVSTEFKLPIDRMKLTL